MSVLGARYRLDSSKAQLTACLSISAAAYAHSLALTQSTSDSTDLIMVLDNTLLKAESLWCRVIDRTFPLQGRFRSSVALQAQDPKEGGSTLRWFGCNQFYLQSSFKTKLIGFVFVSCFHCGWISSLCVSHFISCRFYWYFFFYLWLICLYKASVERVPVSFVCVHSSSVCAPPYRA